MKKKIIVWMIVSVGIVLVLTAMMFLQSTGKTNISKQEGVANVENIQNKDTQTGAPEAVVEAEMNGERLADETEEKGMNEAETEGYALEPTIIAIISEGPDKDTIIMDAGEEKQSTVEIGVQEVGEGSPDIEDDGNDVNVQEPTEVGENNEEQMEQTSTQEDDGEEQKKDVSGLVGPDYNTTYQEYEAMSGQEQMLFYYSFANAEEFTEWYNAAKAEYDESIDKVYIGLDGVVNAKDVGK